MAMSPVLQDKFQLSEAFFQDLTARILKRGGSIMLLALGAGWYMAGAPTDAFGMVVFLLLLCVAGGTMWLNVRRQHRSFRSYRIAIDGTSLNRTQENYAPLAIQHADVTRVIESRRGGVVVMGAGRGLMIGIPPTLERYDEFRTRLTVYHPIELRPDRSWSTIATFAASLGALGAMLVVYRSKDPRYVLLAAGALLVFLVYSFVQIQRSPALDKRVKRASWWMIPLLLSLVAAIYSALHQLNQ